MKQMQYLVHQIPFFSRKKCSIYLDIYHNDNYPACLLVSDGTAMYKVRFPGVLNRNSVESEYRALKLLSEYGVAGIPKTITTGIVNGIPYIIECYIEGSSLDKIHNALSYDDWEHIAHRLASFLHNLAEIHTARPHVFKNPGKVYNSYGDVISESILKHLDKHTSSGLISSDLANRIRETIEDIDSVFSEDATFLHFDIKPQNIVFNPQSRGVAFIDYEHSRMGDYTHEIFRTDMAAVRNPYFCECWRMAKQAYLDGWCDSYWKEKYSQKLFFYELLYNISEMTYFRLIGDQAQVVACQNGIVDKLRQH